MEEEQTTQWPKEKGKKDKQRSTKHTHKITDRVTRTTLKTGGDPEGQADGNISPKKLIFARLTDNNSNNMLQEKNARNISETTGEAVILLFCKYHC